MTEDFKNVIRQTVGPFERIVQLRPAWNKRHTDPKKDYGVHCVDLTVGVVRERAAVDFELFTGWYLPTPGEGRSFRRNIEAPYPANIGYHAPAPWGDWQESPTTEDCLYTGGVCYCDGSGLDADTVFDILREKGLDGVFAALEERWVETFGGQYA